MRSTFITFSLCLATALAGCNGENKDSAETNTDTSTVTTKETAPEPEAPKMDSAAMVKAWMDYATPGSMHTWMASTDGTWSGEVQSWMSPDAPPTTSTATITSKTVMGGRYQHSAYKGTMNGMPFEGMGTLAYDNAKKVFVTTWIDNMGTGLTMLEGKMDEATKTINFEGMMTDPMTGKDSKLREVVKYADAKTQTMEMYCEKDGKEMKMMAMTLTKK